MSRSAFPRSVGLLALAAAAAPLSAQGLSESDPNPAAISQDGPTVELTPSGARPGIDGGEPRIEPLPSGRRPVPPPIRARWAPGVERDELVAEGEGDPFFVGFAGGELRAPEGERVDPRVIERLVYGASDARPSRTTYAYAMLSFAVSEELAAELEAAGARVLGFRPHNAFALAVDADALAAIEALDFVRWIGAARPSHKLHPRTTDAFTKGQPGEPGALIVSVFESDLGAASRMERVAATHVAGPGGVRETHEEAGARWHSEGWQQRALEGLGVEVREYLPTIRAFRVRAAAADVPRIAELDFVEFVEADAPVFPMHDDSQPMIGTDYTRGTYNGNWSGEVVGAHIDSGLDLAHTGLDHAWYLGWSVGTLISPWVDLCEHGTHVAGSILVRPHAALAELRGAVPSLGVQQSRSFRTVKIFDGVDCDATGASYESMYSLMRAPILVGTTVSAAPHFVNNSWGSDAGTWFGTEAGSRAVDAEVWSQNQVYLFAAGNDGPASSTLSQQSSAKNAISVGNVLPSDGGTVGPPSTLWTASSRGPTGDARWKPNVVAPGQRIRSADASSGNGYSNMSGTSMASPHVAGVVAQTMDRNAFLRNAPARVASLLMATAHTKDAQTISGPSSAHLNTYGAGRVDAIRAVDTDSQHAWINWGFTLGSASTAWEEFTVDPAVQRLVVVMHYIETAPSAGAGKALVNDFDLVLDAAPFSPLIDQGDYLAQQSNRNNTEIRIIDNPQSGAWRWKVHPVSTSSSVRMGVTVHMIYATPTPNPTLTLQADKVYVKPNEDVALWATVANPSHVASGVWITTNTTTSAILLASTMTLKDGFVADLTDNLATDGGRHPTLGNIRHGTNRRVDWSARWSTQGTKTWRVRGRSDNGMDRTAELSIVVDGTPPAAATGLASTTHTAFSWSKNPEIGFSWTHASDNLSGIGGYSRIVTQNNPAMPGTTASLGAVTSFTTTPLTSNTSPWYFSLRAVDKSGNWSNSYASAGPYYIDTIAPGTATFLASSSHQIDVWSNNPVVNVSWVAATDAHSGIAGYNASWTTIPVTPSETLNLGAVTSTQSPAFGSSTLGRHFTLRARDVATNWSPNFVSIGPFRIDVTPPVVSSIGFSGAGSPAMTTNTAVTLSLSASDAHSGLGLVRLKNGNGAWSSWMPYGSTVAWNLTSFGGGTATGTRTVHVEVRDVAGNVTAGSAQIFYYRPHWTIGSSGVGAIGSPSLQVSGIFGLGKTVSIQVKNTAAPWRQLVLGASSTSWSGIPLPLDLAFFGAPGNTLLVSPDLVLYEGVGDTLNLTIPALFAGAGNIAYLQWLLLGDPSGAPVVTTQAVGFEINGA